MQTDAAPGGTGLAATFKKKGSNVQERIYATPTKDVTANQWNHVVFTRQGADRHALPQRSADRPAHRPDADDDRRRSDHEQLAGAQRLPRPGVRRTDGRRAPVHHGPVGRRRLRPVRRRQRAGTTTTVTRRPASPSAFDDPHHGVGDGEGLEPTPTRRVSPSSGSTARSVGSQVDGDQRRRSRSPRSRCPRASTTVEVRFVAADGWRDSVGTAQHTVARPRSARACRSTTTSTRARAPRRSTPAPTQPSATPRSRATPAGRPTGQFGAGVNLPGGVRAGTSPAPERHHVRHGRGVHRLHLGPPDALPNWTTHVQIGKDTTSSSCCSRRPTTATAASRRRCG